jgi:threonine dehydrogenase-like Zn-dependent dehydrogenase
MRGVVMYTAGDVRVEEHEDPKIIEPTDAIVRLTATCICGSDLWPYRGIEERGNEGVAKIKELTNGLGAHSVIEAVGTQESTMQAIGATRPGGGTWASPASTTTCPSPESTCSSPTSTCTAAPRRFLPDLIQLIWDRKIDPGKVFDLTLPLEQAPEGYKAMHERRAIKTLLRL